MFLMSFSLHFSPDDSTGEKIQENCHCIEYLNSGKIKISILFLIILLMIPNYSVDLLDLSEQ